MFKSPSCTKRSEFSSPGPGNYEGNYSVIKDRIPTYDFGKCPNKKSFISKELIDKPGPGSYDYNSKGVPSFTFGNKLINKYTSDAPGPGSYEPKSEYVKDSVRSPSINKGDSKSKDLF